MTVILLAGCFSPWDGGNGTITISLGAASGRSVNQANIELPDNLIHEITLTGSLGTIKETLKPGELTAQFSVRPGRWDITVKAYLEDELYAEGENWVNVIAGVDNHAPITMKITEKVPEERHSITVYYLDEEEPFAVIDDVESGSMLEKILDSDEEIKKLLESLEEKYNWYIYNSENEEWDVYNIYDKIVTANITLKIKLEEVENQTPDPTFTITFAQIIDQAANINIPDSISLSAGSVLLIVDGSYNSVEWYIGDILISDQQGFALNGSILIANGISVPGVYYLTLEVAPASGGFFSKTVNFRVQ